MRKECVPFFSIIMPVYNAEKFLSAAIESVLNQSCQDFELVLVEDHSEDMSYSICRKYASEHHNILLFRTSEHQGVSNARNTGVQAVRGTYVTFVDSDDWIEEDLLQTVMHKVVQHAPVEIDIIKYGVIEDYYDDKGRPGGSKAFYVKDALFYGNESVRRNILPLWHATIFAYLCATFFKREALHVNQWNFNHNLIMGEDLDMNIAVYSKASSLLCLSYLGYHYNKRVGISLTTLVSSEIYYENYMSLLKKLFQKYKEWGLLKGETESLFFWLYIKAAYQTVSRCLEQADRKKASDIIKERIFQDEIFYEFCKVKMKKKPLKRWVMGILLKNKNEMWIIFLCRLINFVKHNFRIGFAYLKN